MDYRIAAALQMIEGDIGTPPRARQIAAVLRLSLSRFYELFRRETGMVPLEYLRRLRMSRACDLLVWTDYSVKEIAGLVGVNDVSHFVRDFERLYGVSPRVFRRQNVPLDGIDDAQRTQRT
jgi:AraC-like DNA-binding protein